MNTSRLMIRVQLALLPGFLLLAYFYGAGIVLNVAFAMLFSLLVELAALKFRDLPRSTVKDGSALLTGALLGLALPPYLPLWMILIGCVFAIIFAKHIYGGLGQNLFNPAMVGYAVRFSPPLTEEKLPLAKLRAPPLTELTPPSPAQRLPPPPPPAASLDSPPLTEAQLPLASLKAPPVTEAILPLASPSSPPLTEASPPLASLNNPPVTEENSPLAMLRLPPLTDEKSPLALLRFPPLTEAKAPLIALRRPATRPPKLP